MRRARRGPECPGDTVGRAYGTGWALAIPIQGGWVGSTPPRHPPSHTPPRVLPLPHRAVCTTRPVLGHLGHAHMTVLDTAKEILGVEYAQSWYGTPRARLRLCRHLPPPYASSSPARSPAPSRSNTQLYLSYISVISHIQVFLDLRYS